MEFTEASIEELLHEGNLTITKDIKWKPKNGLFHYEFVLPVENKFQGETINLTIKGTKNSQTKDYSYCLLLNRLRIRGLDPFKRHTNRIPVKERINGTHKHKWCDQINDTYAYKPIDITDVTNMRLTFHQFLAECNITLLGKYTDPPPIQYNFNL